MQNDILRPPHGAPGGVPDPDPSSQGPLPAGALLGELRLDRVLGQGEYGIVYLAHDLALKRPVAVKEYFPRALTRRTPGAGVSPRSSADAPGFEIGLRAFLDEAQLLARFDHPALVRVLRFWEANGSAYMSMNWVEGPTLQAWRAGRSRPPDEAWLRDTLLLPLLDVLQTLHEASCLHRDISPSNIVLEAGRRPVLLDLGAARRVRVDGTQPITAVLNPAYAPLEQYADGGEVRQGPWTDIYSLAGVVLYAITGEAPAGAPARAAHPTRPASEIVRASVARHDGLPYSPAFLGALDAAFEVVPSRRLSSAATWRELLCGPSAAPPSSAPSPQDGAGEPRPPAAPAPVAVPHEDAVPHREVPVDEAVREAIHDVVRRLPFPSDASARETATGDASAHMSLRLEPELDAWPGRERAVEPGAAPSGPPRPPRAWEAWRWLRAVAVTAMLATVAMVGWQLYRHGDVPSGRALAAVFLQDLSAAIGHRPAPDAPDAPDGQPRGEATGPTAQARPSGDDTAAGVPDLASAPGPGPLANPRSQAAAAVPVHGTQAAAQADPPPAPESAVAAVTATANPPAESSTPSDRPSDDAAPPPAGRVGSARAATPAPRMPATPREACGARTNFSLYYCMQKQCREAVYRAHAQCRLLRERDIVAE